MSIDSALKKFKKAHGLLEKTKKSGKHKLRKIAEDKYDKAQIEFLIEWFRLMKFSKNQVKVFSRLCSANMENYPNRDITSEEVFEIVYNSTVQTLILIPKKEKELSSK